MKTSQGSNSKSSKSAVVAFFLCLFLGVFGIHRFYVKKIGTGLLMLVTGGLFGLWTLIDLIFIVNNKFEDSEGNSLVLTQSPSTFKKAMMVIGSFIAWFVVYVALLLTIVMYATSGLVSAVQGQLYALRSGDIYKAYSYTSKDFQKATSLDEFKRFLDQYPSLKDNESYSFSDRKIENNDTGTLTGMLTSRDGAKTPVEYQLIKEGGVWKILGITVNPTGAGVEIKNNNTSRSNDVSSFNVYEDKNNKYSMKYPSNWEYDKPEKGTVVFSGKQGTSSFYSTVNIQTILTKQNGGEFSTVEEMVNSLKSQITDKASHGKIIAEGKAELPQNPKRFHGEYIVFTYTYKNHELKQMQFVISRDDGQVFYAWAYTAPIADYDKDLPTAKAMYESWEIK